MEDLKKIRLNLSSNEVQFDNVIILIPEEPAIIPFVDGDNNASMSSSMIVEVVDEVLEPIYAIDDERKEKLRKLLDLSSNTIIDDDQYLVLNVFLDRFTGKYTKALKLLILGGPGAGKTFILNLASKLTNGKFTYTAAGGSAAGYRSFAGTGGGPWAGGRRLHARRGLADHGRTAVVRRRQVARGWRGYLQDTHGFGSTTGI